MTIALASLVRGGNVVINTLLQDPDGAIDDMVERYHTQTLSSLLCKSASMRIPRGNGTFIHNYEDLPAPKINQLVIPTGATRWAYCILLADDTIANAIYTASSHGTVPMNLLYGTPLNGVNEQGNIISLTVWVLPPRRVSPESLESGINNLWLIPVVDDRYYWQNKHTDALAAEISSEEITTPDKLIDLLLEKTGTDTLNVKASPEYTLLPVCATENDYENLPIMIDTVLTHYGQSLVADIGSWDVIAGKYGDVLAEAPPGGRTRYVSIDGANSTWVLTGNHEGQTGLKACTWGTGSTLTQATSAAARNVFRQRPQLVAGGASSYYPAFGPYGSVPDSVDIQTTPGTFENKPVSELGPLYKAAGGGPAIWRTNFEGTLTSAAKTRISIDYYHQYRAQYDYTFAGVQVWQQTRFDDYMVFRQTWNNQTQAYDAYTRVCSRQPNLTGEWASNSNATTDDGSSGGSGCPCNCIENGDIIVGGIVTSSRWSVPFSSDQVITLTNGSARLPSGTYTIVYDEGSGTWKLDIGRFLTATYISGASATTASTLDGTITMTRTPGSPATVGLCITADIPEEPEES